MAITIEQSPDTYSPVFNPMEYVVSSNNLAGNDFFFFLVRIKDSSGNVISQHRYTPRPDNELALVDVAPMLEAFVSYDISGIASPSYGVRYASNVVKEYSVDFIEEYGSVASALTSGNTQNSGTKFAFNGAFDYNEFQDYDQADWLITPSTTAQFLTDMRGGNIRVKTGDSFDLGIMNNTSSSPVKKIVVKTYDYSNSLIDTYKFDNAYAANTATADKFLNVLVGPDDLNSTTLSTGAQPVIHSSVKFYEVYVENNSGARNSDIITFELDRKCYKADGVRLFWLNSLGRIDSFNFNFQNDDSINIIKSLFNKVTGSFSGAAFSRSTHESGVTNFYNKVTKMIKLRTDYISDVEAGWLQYMIASPIHWIQYGGRLISVTLKTESYNIQTIEKNKLFSVEVDFEYSNHSFRQRL